MGRTILEITGADRAAFLQGLVTNDMRRLPDGPVYAAMLTPQGKFLADFIVLEQGDSILVDVHSTLAAGLAQRLNMYKLRADVKISESPLQLSRGLGAAPKAAVPDPRHAALGWRHYAQTHMTDDVADDVDWDAIRVAHLIPETGIELTGETYILEAGFERLNGVDFRKGCYVGQEVTARMKHKTELKKGLARVEINGAAPPGTPITAGGEPGGKPVGILYTQSGGHAIAHLRFGRAGGEMLAGDAQVLWRPDAAPLV